MNKLLWPLFKKCDLNNQGILFKFDTIYCPHIYYAPTTKHLGALHFTQVYAKYMLENNEGAIKNAKFECKILLNLALNANQSINKKTNLEVMLLNWKIQYCLLFISLFERYALNILKNGKFVVFMLSLQFLKFLHNVFEYNTHIKSSFGYYAFYRSLSICGYFNWKWGATMSYWYFLPFLITNITLIN